MSRFLYRNLELLEPYEGKLSCTVLRGESSRKEADLPDQIKENEIMKEVIVTSIIKRSNLNKNVLRQNQSV